MNTTKTELEELINQANTAINAVKAMRATTTSVGMVQLSTSASATDPNAAALSVTEKNATINDSLANRISSTKSSLTTSINNISTNLTNSINTINKTMQDHGVNGISTYTSFNSIPMTGDFRHCIVHYSGVDTSAPITNSDPDWWWEVIAMGGTSRGTQIAFSVFRSRSTLFLRQIHDNTWFGWYKVDLTIA